MKRKSIATTKSTATSTPNVPSWIQGPYQQIAGAASRLMDMDPSSLTTPESALQTQAFNAAGQASPYQDYFTQATERTRNANTAPAAARGVQAGSLEGRDLSGYFDPYQKDVIDASMADYEDLLGRGMTQLKAGTPTGAFGGSRQGVAMGQYLADAARGQANQLANLRSQGYQRAQNLAGADLDRRYNADAFNANAGMQADQFNADFGMRNAAQLSALGSAGDANRRANIDQQAALGQAQREIANQNDPEIAQVSLYQTLAQLLGAIPTNTFTGQTTNQSGTSTNTSSPSFMDSIGRALDFGRAGFGNPFSLGGRK